MGGSAEPTRQELLTALTTEHFTLQGARAQAASESASRASLFVLSLSSALVALGFLGQDARSQRTFEVFALLVLPTIYLLGVFTYIRVVECGAEDYRYGVAINRIRHFYKEMAGDQARLFLLSGHDDGPGVFGNVAVIAEGRSQLFTFASVIAVIDSVVAAATTALAIGTFTDAPLGLEAGCGAAAGLLSVLVLLRGGSRLLQDRAGSTQSIFPTTGDIE